jgi:phage baseplate assembly protein W|tara:strand:- start:507 stop:998 length:492 start_codon:yes stop_codon:yes gene_type:complete
MAIKDIDRKPYINDNKTDVFIGLDLPIHKSNGPEGFFASTSTTIEAVKNNIRNLINTQQGERLMQPRLGLNLRELLFEQIEEDTRRQIEADIVDKFSFWLPFVQIQEIDIRTTDEDSSVSVNTIKINIVFSIAQDPNTLDSVQIVVTQDENNSGVNNTGTGGY